MLPNCGRTSATALTSPLVPSSYCRPTPPHPSQDLGKAGAKLASLDLGKARQPLASMR